MYDHFSTPDLPGTSRPTPRWVLVVLFGPFLAVLISVVLLQITDTRPSWNQGAQVAFVIAMACTAMGHLSVLGACVFYLFKKRGSRRAG